MFPEATHELNDIQHSTRKPFINEITDENIDCTQVMKYLKTHEGKAGLKEIKTYQYLPL